MNLFLLIAHAQIEIGSPGALSGSVPAIIRVIDSAYDYAFLIGGFLAFAAIVYGGVRYTFSGGSHSAESDARDQITQAVLGLLLLLGAYVVLNTISPTLTSFQLPTLDKITAPELVGGVPISSGCQVDFRDGTRPECFANTNCDGGSRCVGPCQTYTAPQCRDVSPEVGTTRCTDCVDSPGVVYVLAALAEPYKSVPATTYQGSHSRYSCHFGGRNCNDGAHAIDWGLNNINRINGERGTDMTLDSMQEAALAAGAAAGAQIECFCEDANGERGSCSGTANHVHCNVNNNNPNLPADEGRCGCN